MFSITNLKVIMHVLILKIHPYCTFELMYAFKLLMVYILQTDVTRYTTLVEGHYSLI